MKPYRNALCWIAAILGLAAAGIFGVIEETSMNAVLPALAVAGWMAVRGQGCSLRRTA